MINLLKNRYLKQRWFKNTKARSSLAIIKSITTRDWPLLLPACMSPTKLPMCSQKLHVPTDASLCWNTFVSQPYSLHTEHSESFVSLTLTSSVRGRSRCVAFLGSFFTHFSDSVWWRHTKSSVDSVHSSCVVKLAARVEPATFISEPSACAYSFRCSLSATHCWCSYSFGGSRSEHEKLHKAEKVIISKGSAIIDVCECEEIFPGGLNQFLLAIPPTNKINYCQMAPRCDYMLSKGTHWADLRADKLLLWILAGNQCPVGSMH